MAHKAQIVRVAAVADGLLAVHARCCADPTTESVLTLGGLDREDTLIDADIAGHLARVEKQHDARDRTKAQIQRLCPSK